MRKGEVCSAAIKPTLKLSFPATQLWYLHAQPGAAILDFGVGTFFLKYALVEFVVTFVNFRFLFYIENGLG